MPLFYIIYISVAIPNILVEQSNGVLAEIQLHLRLIFETKMGKGTKLYEESRSLHIQMKTASPEKIVQLSERMYQIKVLEKYLYENAWKISNKN